MAETYSPPAGVRAAARRALDWIADGKAGRNFTDVGRKRASDLARGAAVSEQTIRRMNSFFARHEVDKRAEGFRAGEKGYPSPGRVAWDAWGGDPGQSWARGIVRRLEAKTERSYMSKNEWKYTIPVLRAEDRSDGAYLIGEASGPERDSHGTAMAPEAIADFARQIADRVAAGDPIPYIDSHLKVGVLRELGWVMEGEITPDFHLRVAVRLDEANPAAMFIHNNVQRGKQYGMSVAGDGTEFQTVRDDDGNRFIRFTRVLLREISNTTRPSWVPSLGTVLARSLDGELTGDNAMADDLTEVAAPAEETTAPAEAAPAPENADADAQATDTTDATEEAPAAEGCTCEGDCACGVAVEAVAADDVDRARIAQKDKDSLLAAYMAMGEQLKALGVIEDAAASAPENTQVENSDQGDDADLVDINGVKVERSLADAISGLVTSEVTKATESLTKTLSEQAEYIKALESMPAGKRPAPVVRDKFESVEPDLTAMSPEERLRWGLSGIYGNR